MKTRSSTAQRLLKLITGVSLMTLGAAVPAFAVPPNTAILSTFEKEVLTPASQAGNAWKNVAPNALADYYTYQPLTNADALLAGFPAICGDKRIVTGADATSTADCYIITVRQLVQPLSLNFLNLPGVSAVSGTNAFPGPGLIQADGFTPFADATTVGTLQASATAGNLTTGWGYGSGGNNWKPYYQSALVPGPTLARGNAPAAFAATPINLFLDNTHGDPAALGIWHFPAPSIKGTGSALPGFTGSRPVLVLWLNELPNNKPVGLDPSVDCGDNAPFCYPWNRIVTHVHGAHVGPESDGLAVAWYTPNFALDGEGAFKTGAVYNYTYKVAAAAGVPANIVGSPIYYYPMTQEAGTIWYHDHAVGTTHNNVDMGMAGFFPITDTVEKGLQTPTAGPPAVPAVLPTGTGNKYELGLAFQDRHFDINGQIIMPAAAVYDKTDPNCVFDINNDALPGTCKRLNWMYTISAAPTATDPQPKPHLVPYVLGAPELTPGNPAYAYNFPAGPIDPATGLPTACQVNTTNTFINVAGVDPVTGARVPFTQCAPFPATSSTLEYFGNIPMVNGVTYAVMDVEPTVYRMRLLAGSDSRTWIPQLTKSTAVPSMMNCGGGAAPAGCAVYDAADVVPFFQVGSEQGLLASMVQRNEIDLMPGERVDVLVDFTNYAGQTITMKNLGDDAPYSGRFDFDTIATRMPTSLDIPEIMKFRVSAAPVAASAQAPVNGKALKTATVVGTPVKTRTIALIEITDQYGRTMPTIDGRGFVPPGIRTTEVIGLNSIEQWDIVNTTVDAHPMHLHQVAFEAIDRVAFDRATGFMAGANYTFGAELANCHTAACREASVFTPSQYVPLGTPQAVAAYDAGPKDTIQVPPGYVARVKALFDIPGDYVWHCHILSHEEHDMMRPFRVTSAAALVAPTSVTVGAVVNGAVTVTVSPAPVAPIQAVVQYRIVGSTFWLTSDQKTSVQTINLVPSGVGTYEFRAQFMEPALQNVHANTAPDSATTAGNVQATYSIGVPTAPTATNPTGAIANVTPSYVWTAIAGADSYDLYIDNSGVVTTTNYLTAAAACVSGGSCTVTSPALPVGASVHWAVRAINALGTGPWSNALNFNVTAPIPTAVSPSVTATTTPVYTWTNTGAISYDLYIDNSGVASTTNFTAAAAACVPGGNCTHTSAALPVGASVYWAVRGNYTGGTSAYSAPLTFKVQ